MFTQRLAASVPARVGPVVADQAHAFDAERLEDADQVGRQVVDAVRRHLARRVGVAAAAQVGAFGVTSPVPT